ncbi:ABC transporter ATP-binding protein [bacterium]|nr:ABC transporter ATP-binding protein [bacterium]
MQKFEPEIKISDLTLTFNAQYFYPSTWRDRFVNLYRPPSVLSQPENILKNINLNFKNRERVGLLGLNGAGKTSLCRCIAGTYKPTQGSVEVRGQIQSIADVSIGLFPELTGRENIKILSELLHPDKESKDFEDEICSFSGLRKYLDLPYKHYSNGMKARLALSAISSHPSDILILDEVFDGADMGFRAKIGKRVHQMIDNSGIVLFVSHNPRQVLEVCNRAIVIFDSEVILDGTPEEAVAEYESLCRANEN